VLLALALLPLAACGRRGRPEYPEDVDPKFPRVYPVLPEDRNQAAPKSPPAPPVR